jgi:hypothetical protein
MARAFVRRCQRGAVRPHNVRQQLPQERIRTRQGGRDDVIISLHPSIAAGKVLFPANSRESPPWPLFYYVSFQKKKRKKNSCFYQFYNLFSFGLYNYICMYIENAN